VEFNWPVDGETHVALGGILLFVGRLLPNSLVNIPFLLRRFKSSEIKTATTNTAMTVLVLVTNPMNFGVQTRIVTFVVVLVLQCGHFMSWCPPFYCLSCVQNSRLVNGVHGAG
jgi:hypothetical protein